MVTALVLAAIVIAFCAGFFVARRRRAPGSMLPETELSCEPEYEHEDHVTTSEAVPAPANLTFDPIAVRGTQSFEPSEQSLEWQTAMREVGERYAAEGVGAIVFVHGTFMGTDPLSAARVLERALPRSVAPHIVRAVRRLTRHYIGRTVGDLGNFGSAYVRLFEDALRPAEARIPCTEFVWSSENHHVGRLEGALGLVRVLATHAELSRLPARRILVIGHSHAGQIFALTTQLFARSLATEAILDVARARGLDVGALEVDLATLAETTIDFVTFGSPNRYAWARVPNARVLHVIASPRGGPKDGDLIRRLGVEGSDFPPLDGEERRINIALAEQLGFPGFAPKRVALALRSGSSLPTHGEVAFVEYGELGVFSGGLTHAVYTRIDGMLFHARLIAERFYRSAPPASVEVGDELVRVAEAPPHASAPLSARAWGALRALGPAKKTPPA